jgi:hypothetical protein
VRAVCPVEEAAALRALTGLVLLAAGTDRPDADLVLETLRGGDLTRPVRLGLASLALADRWTVEMEPRTGRVLALNIQVDNRPARLAIGRGQPVRLTLQVADRAAGAWNLAKEDSSATEASLEVLLEAKVAQMADAETALRGLSAVATGLGGTITGPEALVVRWRGGRMTTLAVQAPALLPADARHEAIRRLPTAGQSALSLRVRGGRIDRAMEAASLSAGCRGRTSALRSRKGA